MGRSRLARIALADNQLGRFLRWLYRAPEQASLPIPGWVAWPFARLLSFARRLWYALVRIFVCEPYLKAYCRQYGRNLRTGPFLHWIQGSGDLIVGDDVLFDGKISISFARRFSEHPTLKVGDRSGIGHGCRIVVADRVEIGADCRIAAGVSIFDSHGHPSDPERRRQGLPPDAESVKPVIIGDNVWIGTGSFVFPGVRIGEGSIVSAGSVVLSDVPAAVVVAGNPARKIGMLTPGPANPQPQSE